MTLGTPGGVARRPGRAKAPFVKLSGEDRGRGPQTRSFFRGFCFGVAKAPCGLEDSSDSFAQIRSVPQSPTVGVAKAPFACRLELSSSKELSGMSTRTF